MGQNNGNGNNPPKVELELNQEARFKILKPVYAGQSSYGKFYLYSVQDLGSGEIRSLFATEEIHSIIEEKQLGVGSEFLLKRVANGKKGSSKLELSILEKSSEPHLTPSGDNLKELLFQSIRDAVEVVRDSGVQFSNEEISKLSVTIFIQRSRLA
ncbi:MAG: hypothetical protein NTU47_04085 [Ignavibacteriales bacterium]|nr:hypothetical protein [Ignavibacteriales bacterium]